MPNTIFPLISGVPRGANGETLTLKKKGNPVGGFMKKDIDFNNLSKGDKELLKQLIYSLQYELDKSVHYLSNEYRIDESIICSINDGNVYRLGNKVYPLRKNVYAHNSRDDMQIIDLLRDTDIEQREIAKMFNVSVSYVYSLNRGERCGVPNQEYPIRKHRMGNRKSFSPNEVREIEDLLKNHLDVSIRKIAEMYETGITIIQNINIGSIIRFRQNDSVYPLRNKTPVSTIRV